MEDLMSYKLANLKSFIIIVIFILSFPLIIKANNTSSEKSAREANILRHSKIINGQLIEIQIEKKKFDKKAHKIEGKEYSLLIDGKEPIGTPVIPTWEISNFIIKWNEKSIEVPKELYQDCYEPNIRGVTLLPSQDGKSILLHMNGSDGSYTYDAYWVIESSRIYSRYIWKTE